MRHTIKTIIVTLAIVASFIVPTSAHAAYGNPPRFNVTPIHHGMPVSRYHEPTLQHIVPVRQYHHQ